MEFCIIWGKLSKIKILTGGHYLDVFHFSNLDLGSQDLVLKNTENLQLWLIKDWSYLRTNAANFGHSPLPGTEPPETKRQTDSTSERNV